MSDKENSNDNDQAPKSIDQLINQVKASIEKEKLGALKGQLTALFKEKAEAERAVAQVDNKINDLITKHRAGL